MKFERLKLTNIGAFHGKFDFDLSTNDKMRNVILFGGKNGSGKTTILEAIRLVLFGTFAYGLKTESAAYFEKIESKLNTIAKKNNEKDFNITLELQIVENFKRNYYTINRAWFKQRNNIKENLTIFRNNKELNEREKDIFQLKLREESPPQLLEFCLFDGEKISQIVTNEMLSSYLQQTAKVMFNLDLFESLEFDLENYLKQDNVYSSFSQEEQDLIDLEQELKSLDQQKHRLSIEYQEHEAAFEEKEAELKELYNQFDIHGGLVKERRDSLIKEMNEIEHQRLSMMEKNKEFITTLMPFVLVRDLLQEAVDQMHEESKLDVQESVKELINQQAIMKMVQPYIARNEILVDAESISTNIYNNIMDLLSVEGISRIHAASVQQKSEIEAFFRQLQEYNPETLLTTFQQNAVLLKQVQEIRKQIDENDASSDLKSMLERIQILQNDLSLLKLQMEQLEVLQNQLSETIQSKEIEYQQFKNKIVNAKKSGHILEITSKISEVSRSFRKQQMKKKLQQVELEAAHMLQDVFRKELFVTRVKINPENFELKIFDSSHEEIKIESLSAGEKQILLLSIVWAMAMCSNRRLPFIFDTLLGRLDQTHKKSIIERFIPKCGDQVIILSTDSEINEEHFNYIKARVAKTYTIDFNTKTSTVDVSQKYFDFIIDIEEINDELSVKNI